MEAPDEANHLWVAHFLSTHRCAPSYAEIISAGNVAIYGPLPPFGYLPNALAGMFADSENFRLAARLGTLIAGFPTMLAAFLLGKELFSNRFLSIMLPLLVVVHPQLVFTQSYTNTDGLVTTLCSLAICLCVRSIKGKVTIGKASLTGFLMGWAVLCKTNSLALVAALAFGLWSACRLQAISLIETLKVLAAFGGTLATTSIWWYVRNYFEFNHDCLGTRTMYILWEKVLPHVDGKPILPWPYIDKLSWWRFVFFDFWGLFGFMNRYLWRPLYFAFLGLCLVACGGYWRKMKVVGSADSAGSADAPKSADSAPESAVETAVWQFLTVCAALNMVAAFYVTASGLSGPHGRYLFPAELPLLALILGGFSRFGERAARILSITLLVLCLVSTIGGWIVFYADKSWKY